ncbi:MAG: acetate--CoA ligase [Betaproteobacteria bacterium]|nr:acetate--CoA ligase [Betaproteobacteria bacterium]MDH4325685.1 acetate--CoA ligase [Betaproteobacteria bacterium]
MSSNIESVLHETRVFPPAPEFAKKANIPSLEAYQKLCAEAEKDFEGFWGRLAKEHLLWHKPFTKVLDESKAPFFRWFHDGELNASYNCLDRHLKSQPDKVAIIFEADDGKVTKITYKALYHEVCKLANALKAHGVKTGDRILIYMPMSIQVVVAMQACARIGATHSVVFGGFSAKSLQERIVDAGATEVITADGQFRGGREIPLKPVVDEAFAMGGCDKVKNVIVYKRTGSKVPMQAPRDKWWDDVVKGQADTCEPTWVNAEHPLFILYTSGSTGKPKGIQHSTGGYLLWCALTMKWVFDNKPEDVFWCTADVGWVTGHSYIVYGPLAVGTTEVMFEGIPTYPDAGRFWKIIQDHKVNVFYTAPTAIRSLIKAGADQPKKYDLKSLRILGTVGEPINPEAWIWYHETVGGGRCPIVDTWWQTETGGHMISPLPGAIATKPGSATFPLPGIMADIVDETGKPVGRGKGGILVIKRPWPAMLRTIWGDPERYRKTYYPADFKGQYYLAGDGASTDEDGYYRIMGRIDDVLNVSGHRLGTMEVESALVAHTKLVAEAAVVGRPDDLTGEAIVAFVVTKGPRPTGEEAKKIAKELRDWVGKEIGPIAKPKDIRFGDNLPKTRSGKIMRRLLRAIAKGEEIKQDVSTLENPAILEQLAQKQ